MPTSQPTLEALLADAQLVECAKALQDAWGHLYGGSRDFEGSGKRAQREWLIIADAARTFWGAADPLAGITPEALAEVIHEADGYSFPWDECPHDSRNNGCMRAAKHIAAIRALIAKRNSAPEQPRCERCGWPLAADAKDGCVPGNCMCRPLPDPEAAQRRVERRSFAREAEALKAEAMRDATMEFMLALAGNPAWTEGFQKNAAARIREMAEALAKEALCPSK